MTDGLSEDQRLALDQLAELAAESEAVQIVAQAATPDADGSIRVDISLDCSGTPHASGGIMLRRRERFSLRIPLDFPFSLPAVTVTHRRWAGSPHVQWGYKLCLYAAPSVEWVPADGILGLIDRLTEWLDRAARGELDPEDQPLHPPVAYVSADGVVVIRSDIGDLAPPAGPLQRSLGAKAGSGPRQARLVVGVGEDHGDGRFDVVDWASLRDWLDDFLSGRLATHPRGHRLVGTLAVLTDGELSFEYPNRVGALLTGLETLGVNVADFLVALGKVAAINYLLATTASGAFNTVPLRVLIGTPSRRMSGNERRQHLVCWQVDDLGRRIAEGLIWDTPPDELAAELGRRMTTLIKEWMPKSIPWVEVMEARREVTVRRDTQSAAQWLGGRRVLILGAGALGAPLAEHCVRAGASAITIVDNGRVAPGVLVRQPYRDADIHRYKAEVLAERLNGLRDDRPVIGVVANAEAVVARGDREIFEFDLVIDATADASVASLLERCRALRRTQWPHLMSLVVGHDARRGIVTVSRPGATGAGRDILRRLTLAARGDGEARLADIADDFFPREPRSALFQPEPGCSSPTFTGSAAELSALAGHLLDAGLTAIGQTSGTGTEPMVAGVVRLGSARAGRLLQGLDWFGWPNDVVVPDNDLGYEVRISQPAVSEMRAECRRGLRVRGRNIETGGTIFGCMDNACRCIWIDDVSGPPPDSRLSAFHFDHGIEGLRELIDYHRKRSGMATSYLGMWHSHPDGAAAPSETDAASMHPLVSQAVGGPPRALILILGGDPVGWGRWLADEDMPDMFAEVIRRRNLGPQPARPRTPLTHEASWWPGGWKSTRVDAAWPQRRSWLSRLWPLKH